MSYQEALVFFESLLPKVAAITLCCFAFIGIQEFWHELSVAYKGGPQ